MSRSSYSSSSSSSSKSPMQTCVDPLDIDSFINYEAMSYQSPSPSSTRAQMMGRPTSATANPNNTLLPPSSNSNFTQTFSGPSHQYESYKQQTGLPSGALPNTLAVNPPNNMNMFRGSAFSDAEFGLNTTDDLLDFGTMPVADTEMEFDMPPMFFPNDQNTADFIDPSTLGENQEQFNVPAIKVSPSQTNNIGRLYPGAHKQQAALAQAQQEQSKQEQQSGRSRRAAGPQPTDPIVEEKISQLLKSMRQNSASTMSDDDDSTPNANGHSHMARMRKDEEDMDEDERLLASEEGKKLSSKERRQLRNKVSARAFRSRRKEYIGQLEAEIATKVNEADDLKMTNRALMEENTRLTDLTRMLLSSPAFSTFLDNMSTEGVQTTSGPQQTPTPQQQQSTNVKPNVRKDVNPYNAAQQQVQKEEPSDAQIGMALLPETTMDFSLLNGNVGGSWTTWGANQPQVFSVLEIPEGPAVDRFDSGVLSGKSRSTESIFESTSSKVEAPVIERMPTIEADAPAAPAEVHDCDWDESDPAFALFVDTPEPPKSNPQQLAHEDFVDMFGGKSLEQVFARLDLVNATEESHADKAVSAASMEKLQAVCDSIESPMQRIARMTSHL